VPTLITAHVLRWQVQVVGTEVVVNLVSNDPVSFIAPNGGNSNDPSPVLLHYIMSRPAAQREDLFADFADNLLQVVRYQATPVTAPAVPPARRALAQAQVQEQGLAALRAALAPGAPG
jgi:hypothetical protein